MHKRSINQVSVVYTHRTTGWRPFLPRLQHLPLLQQSLADTRLRLRLGVELSSLWVAHAVEVSSNLPSKVFRYSTLNRRITSVDQRTVFSETSTIKQIIINRTKSTSIRSAETSNQSMSNSRHITTASTGFGTTDIAINPTVNRPIRHRNNQPSNGKIN